MVEELIRHGASIDVQCHTTPIHAAFRDGNDDAADVLIKFIVGFTQRDNCGRTPIYEASEGGHVDVVDFLIKCGADCNQSDKDGRTPLHVALEAQLEKDPWFFWFDTPKPDYESTVRALMRSGADINQTDINGESPLSIAVKYNQQVIVELMFEHGAKSKEIKRTKSF